MAASGVTSVGPHGPPLQPRGPHGYLADVATGRCDSCGSDDEDVVPVHRAYVTPEDWDTEGKVEVLEEVEQWCFPCRCSYPHQEV